MNGVSISKVVDKLSVFILLVTSEVRRVSRSGQKTLWV